MSKRQVILTILITVLALILLAITVYREKTDNQKVTFAECEKAGGVVWQVDLYDPDICPSCADFRACENEYNDFREECPECYGACQDCQEKYSLSVTCPECYGPCQTCQNKYLNEFKNDAERYELCPECKKCDFCRETIESQKSNCPPCMACEECKEKNKKYSNIAEVCPQVDRCTECLNSEYPYPDVCPDEKEKIGEIADAATWFVCCEK
jgi:hypothetical protein